MHEDFGERIAEEEIRLLFKRGSTGSLISLFNGLVMVYLFAGRVAGPRLAFWLLAVAVVALARHVLSARFFARPTHASPRRWARAFAAFAGLNGLVWGATAVVLWVPGSFATQLVLGTVLMGMATGSAAMSASYLPAFFAFTVPAMLPALSRFLVAPDRLHHGLGLLLVLFIVFIIRMARIGSRTIAENTASRFRVEQLNQTLERRVDERTVELASALRTRDEFLALASHELRTPITSLRLQLQLLERELRRGGNGRAARLGVMIRQTNRLNGLIHSLLDVSRISEGGLRLSPVPTNLGALVEEVARQLEADLRLKSCELRLALAPDVIGMWDAARLEQVVVNLILNAAKFGAGRPVTVAVSAEGAFARLTVRDEGIGIAPEAQKRIFGRYQRAGPAHAIGGLGLGLFIVDQLVQAMGGQVQVVSEPGKGALFIVTLPRA